MPRPPPSVETVVEQLTTRQHLRLEPALIRATLRRLEQEETFQAWFVRVAMHRVPDARLAEGWERALIAVSKAGRQYSIGDAAFRETMAWFQEPDLLGACQAATVAVASPLVVLASLAQDGSEASFDALIVELERARDGRDDWALRYKLNRLARYAKAGPAWDSFKRQVDAALGRQEQKAEAGGTARKLGLHVRLLKLWVLLNARGRRKAWVMVSLSDRNEPLNVSTDLDPKASCASADRLPAFLAGLEKKHRVQWDWARAEVRTNLRGRHRNALVEWLQGQRERPVA